MKLLQFKAVWCNPCKMQTKEFEESPIDIELEAIDVDEDEKDLANTYKVRSVPTMLLIGDKDEEIHRWVGFTKSDTINTLINSHIKDKL